MAPAQESKKKVVTPKKEKVYHPSSRKAGQLARGALRKSKLETLASKRSQKHDSLVNMYGFFYHALPAQGVLDLPELHHIVREIWLTRFDRELEEERVTRRKGRPKSAREIRLEEIKLREEEEYRTGMEVPDLTHPTTVEIFRRWDQKELAFIQLLRFIRITGTKPDVAVISRPGKHLSITGATEEQEDVKMNDVEG